MASAYPPPRSYRHSSSHGHNSRGHNQHGGANSGMGGGHSALKSTSLEGGARHLARLHGTEEDRTNCSFFFKVGACRHGDRCGRSHGHTLFSTTVLMARMWSNPKASQDGRANLAQKSSEELDADFRSFVEDVFGEVSKFGEVEDFAVCENVGDQLLGHVFVKYFDENDAQKCVDAMRGRFYNGSVIRTEYSPATDFDEAKCKQAEGRAPGRCQRDLMCNFWHIRKLPGHSDFMQKLLKNQPHRGEHAVRAP